MLKLPREKNNTYLSLCLTGNEVLACLIQLCWLSVLKNLGPLLPTFYTFFIFNNKHWKIVVPSISSNPGPAISIVTRPQLWMHLIIIQYIKSYIFIQEPWRLPGLKNQPLGRCQLHLLGGQNGLGGSRDVLLDQDPQNSAMVAALAVLLADDVDKVGRVVTMTATVWRDGKVIFQYLALITMKIWPILRHIIEIAKGGSKCCQILTTPKNSQILIKFCWSGEISPNLVTLVVEIIGTASAPCQATFDVSCTYWEL